jgi:thioredoxin-dependent peroxiredoxin
VPVAVGVPVPSFSCGAIDGSQVSSSSLRGRWALLCWFPGVDSPGCTAQAAGLRGQAAAFDELGVQLVGVSTDEPEDLARFVERHRLRFPLISDPAGELTQAFGMGVTDTSSAPVSVVVDPEGLVRRSWIVDDAEFFAEDVLDLFGGLVGAA